MSYQPAFVVHGGAWDIPDAEAPAHLAGCRRAAAAGWDILRAGGSALDAVETAVRLLEDDPAFDAGHGSWLNAAGEVELDAIIMDGSTLGSGAVAAIQHVRHPVTVARLVMTDTAHSLLVGPGAEAFAQAHGVPRCDESELLTGQELARWQAIVANRDFTVRKAFEGEKPRGTVGAVARDQAGRIAAATSTGGTPNKLAGRVGDSPLIGCGAYADDRSAGASATGWGESIMKVVLCKTACDLVAGGRTAEEAAVAAIEVLRRRADGLGGIILVDRTGRLGLAFNTPRMARAWIEDGACVARIERD
jgi:beta-aspartyl-peptidase (threonine type)